MCFSNRSITDWYGERVSSIWCYAFNMKIEICFRFQVFFPRHIHYLVCRCHRLISFPCCLVVLGTLTTAILKDFRVVIFACAIMDMSWVLCGLSRAPDFSSDYLNLLGNHFMNNDHDVTGSIQIVHINIRLKSDFRFRIRRLFS